MNFDKPQIRFSVAFDYDLYNFVTVNNAIINIKKR